MATLDLCLILVCISRICSAVVKTNVFDLEQNIKDEFSLHDLLHKDREPGVAMFHQHEDCNITAFADTGQILTTLIQDGHIENLTLQFVAFGNRIVIDLHLTRDLFATNYTREILHEKGKDVKESLHRKEQCYYQGQIRDNPASHAALSSCDGFRGYVSDGKETYHIHPVSGAQHRVFRNKDRKKFHLKCGTEKHDVYEPPSQIFGQHTRRKRSIRGPSDSNKFTRFVELYLVNDYRTYDLHGKNDALVFQRSQDIANIVNSLYRQLNIYIVLVGVEVWSMGDKITITKSADTTMENFLRYRKERINPYHPNDNAQLITGIFFDHGVVGKAIKGPICTHQFSGGVSMDYDGLVTLVATTMAHEMGHNFGMEHDSDTKCSCPEDKCIMAATSGQISPHHWSSCSQDSLQEAFDLGMDYCLRNLPKTIFEGPVCGNGFLEEGEECDCGLPEDCTNRCCNATSCVMHIQAECATGHCCDLNTCKPKKGATLCREPKDECDLAEYCDGSTEFCPPDVHIKDGVECSGGQSYCYKGRCHTHNAQCQLLWGNTGRVSDPICFQQLNVRGDHDGNCGYNWTTDRYYNCDRENVMCGLLHCVHLNEKLMFWRDNLALDMRANFLTRGNTQYVCRSTMLDVGLDMPDPGLVPDGAKCEENKICIKQTCTPLVKLKILECPDCNGNGVCNSNGHCHCNVGYAPPLCDRPGFGGSLDSGPAADDYDNKELLIGLLILFLVILPLLILAGLAYFHRQRLLAWWKLGPQIKFGVLKKPQSTAQPPPPPRPSSSFTDKRWSAGPTKPSSSVEISGPLIDKPPSYESSVVESHSRFAGAAPSAPPRPIFIPPTQKPTTVPPKIQPPAARPTPAPAPAPASATGVSTLGRDRVSTSGRDRKAFFGSMNAAQPATEAEKAPLNSAVETNHLPKLLPVNVAAERHQKEREAAAELTLKRQKEKERGMGESTLKRQQKEKGEVKSDDQSTQSPPTSPTKAGRKMVHSQSMREAGTRDQLVPGDKLVKRESFRGTEISNPILVSTTNRDSQVFAEFALDESGIVSRPISKGHSVHGPNPSSELAQDGSRNVVRRSHSDRPLSPKRFGPTATDSLKKSSQSQGFTPRPLPPEPVIETEPVLETEPLYINGGLSDLDDLKAHISSAFDSINLNSPTPVIPPKGTTPTPAVSKPTSSVPRSLLSSTTSKPSTTTTSSNSIISKPTPPISSKPSTGPNPKTAMPFQNSSLSNKASAPSQNNSIATRNFTPSQNTSLSSKTTTSSQNSSISSKAAPLERVLSNAMKTPFSTSTNAGGVTSASKTTTGNESAKPTAGLGNKPSVTSSSGPSVRGPFGSSLNKTSDSTKGSGTTTGSQSSAASRPSTAGSLANRGSNPSSLASKGATASTASKGPTTSSNKGPTTNSSTAGTVGRGPVGSATNKPAAPSKSAFSSTTPSNKTSVASTNKGSTSGPTTAGSSAARKGPGGVGASTTNPGRGSNLQRNMSAANRPSVAPKPGVGKSVRSYNF